MIVNLKNGEYINIVVWKNEKGAYEYYNDRTLIGIFDPKVMNDSKFFAVDMEKNNTLENEISAENKDTIQQIITEVKEQIDKLNLDEIEEEASDNKAISEYLEENGIEEEIDSIKMFDLEREQNEQEKSEKEQNEKEKEEGQKEPESKETYVTTHDVDIKQEIDLDEKATDISDFRKWLGGQLPKDVTKVAVIGSDEMSKMKDENGKTIDNPTTRYGLVAISNGKNGQGKRVEPLKKYIPQLEQNHSSGNNPTKQQYQLNTDGTMEKDAVLSEYRIGNKIIQLDKDYGDNFEVNIGRYAPSSNNELVTTEMRGKNTLFQTDIETRKAVMGEYNKGTYGTKDSYDEIKKREEAGHNVEELTEKDVDGNKSTHSEEHAKKEYIELPDGEKITYEKLAIRWGFYKDGKPDAEYIREKFQNQEKQGKEPQEIIEQLDEEYKDPRAPERGRD